MELNEDELTDRTIRFKVLIGTLVLTALSLNEAIPVLRLQAGSS